MDQKTPVRDSKPDCYRVRGKATRQSVRRNVAERQFEMGERVGRVAGRTLDDLACDEANRISEGCPCAVRTRGNCCFQIRYQDAHEKSRLLKALCSNLKVTDGSISVAM